MRQAAERAPLHGPAHPRRAAFSSPHRPASLTAPLGSGRLRPDFLSSDFFCETFRGTVASKFGGTSLVFAKKQNSDGAHTPRVWRIHPCPWLLGFPFSRTAPKVSEARRK